MGAEYTQAQKKATIKYDTETHERVNCRFKIGTKERVQKLGYTSVAKFIQLAVYDKLEREESHLK